MSGAVATILSIFLLIGAVNGQTKTCNTYTNVGCTTSQPISFVYSGLNNVPNSQCCRTYQLTINVPAGKKGYTCTFFMDRPEQYKYIYSISESTTAIGATATTPYIYGKGLDAVARTKISGSTLYSNNYFTFKRIHSHADDNNYSYITYRFENFKMSVIGSDGQTTSHANPNWFQPGASTKIAYIGVNRRYSTPSDQGSGVCSVECSII